MDYDEYVYVVTWEWEDVPGYVVGVWARCPGWPDIEQAMRGGMWLSDRSIVESVAGGPVRLGYWEFEVSLSLCGTESTGFAQIERRPLW